VIHDIRFQASWDRIKNKKQKIIPSSNKRENLNRIKLKYNVGYPILLQKPVLRRKLSAPKEGSYTIIEIGTNGVVTIQWGIVHERINIRTIEPFFEH
jgi:hypothetical protein